MSERLYAKQKGDGAKTFVLLHGFGGDHGEWTDIQPDLAREGRVLAYDLPGHGRSLGFPGAGNASAAAKAVLADLAARGIARAHVAGFSMGGAIAALMGMRAPDAVASLTLIAPGGFGPDISGPLLERFASPATADDLRAAMDDMAGPDFELPTKNVAGLAAVRSIPGQRAKLEEIVGMIAKDSRQGEIPRSSLAGLKMPVSVIWGDRDPVLPFSQSRDLPEGFVLQVVPGAGHMLPVEARRQVTSLIRTTARNA